MNWHHIRAQLQRTFAIGCQVCLLSTMSMNWHHIRAQLQWTFAIGCQVCAIANQEKIR